MYAIKVDRSSVFFDIGQTTENYFSVYFLGLLAESCPNELCSLEVAQANFSFEIFKMSYMDAILRIPS